jgi:hypothetical protein
LSVFIHLCGIDVPAMGQRLFVCLVLILTPCLETVAADPAASSVTSETAAAVRGQNDASAAVKKSPQFQDLAGELQQPLNVGKNKAAVVIFVLHDCPISNKYAPEIQRLAGEFAPQQIRFYVVHVDPELGDEDARKHAKEYGYKLPVLIDRKHELVRHLKATTAPEAFVLGPEGKVLYRGRIDDRYVGVGKARQQVQRQDLRLALKSIVEGKNVEIAETKPIGCYIPDLDED